MLTDDDEIRCFSHTHMMGAGVVDYGNIGVMATSTLNSDTVTNNGYRSKFSHKNESASAGLLSPLLSVDLNIVLIRFLQRLFGVTSCLC